jgi:hypothetical protein
MNREKAQMILQSYGNNKFNTKNEILKFLRQTENDLDEIENNTDKELIEEWKSLVFVNNIYGMVSINDLQRISLIELEFEERENIKTEDLKDWYYEQKISFEE